jgi:hypothetical protein
MNYTVIWKHSTIDRLTAYYVYAREHGHDTNAITAAVSQIDALLKSDPAHQGESRQEQERILIAAPLVIDFEVFEEEEVVFVLGIRYFYHNK